MTKLHGALQSQSQKLNIESDAQDRRNLVDLWAALGDDDNRLGVEVHRDRASGEMLFKISHIYETGDIEGEGEEVLFRGSMAELCATLRRKSGIAA